MYVKRARIRVHPWTMLIFVYIREPAIFVYIREPFSFRPTFGEDFRFDRTFLRMYADFCARTRKYIIILVEKVC